VVFDQADERNRMKDMSLTQKNEASLTHKQVEYESVETFGSIRRREIDM
jgi:hypothetical protein